MRASLLFCTLLLNVAACEGRCGGERVPTTKDDLIHAVDRALRAEDAARLTALALSAEQLRSLCPDAKDVAARVEQWREAQSRAATGLAECFEMGDWSGAKRVALNLGTDSSAYDDACHQSFRRLERSELYYELDGRVVKVNLSGYSAQGKVGALRSIRCFQKRGSPRDFDRVPENCPGRPWTRVTQSNGHCP